MWPDSPFAQPRSSFERPVLAPTSGPDSSPTRTITLSCAWQVWIRGALQQLLLQSTWSGLTAAELYQVQQWVFQLIDMFDECESVELPFACDYKFTDSTGFWEVDPAFGLGFYVGGHGFGTTLNAGPAIYQAIIHAGSHITGVVTSITLHYDAGPGPIGPNGVNFYYRAGGSPTLHNFFHHDVFVGVNIIGWTGLLDTFDDLVIELNNGGQSSVGYITEVNINGTAFVPPC